MYAHVYSLSLPFYCLFGTLVISSRSRQVIYLIYNIVTVFMVFLVFQFRFISSSQTQNSH